MRARRQRNLSRHQKIFLQKCLSHKGYPPLWDGTIFGQVFGRGGMTKFSKWKVPLPGGQARRKKQLVSCVQLVIAPPPRGLIARSFEMRCTVPVPIPSDLATFKIPTPFSSCLRTFRSVALSIFGRPSFRPGREGRARSQSSVQARATAAPNWADDYARH